MSTDLTNMCHFLYLLFLLCSCRRTTWVAATLDLGSLPEPCLRRSIPVRFFFFGSPTPMDCYGAWRDPRVRFHGRRDGACRNPV